MVADSSQPKLSAVDRLAIGGDVAPVLRRRAGTGRRITTVGRDGKPVRVVDDVALAKSLLARSEIEFSVIEGKRPAFVNCKTCGRPVKTSRKGNAVRTVCRQRTHKCQCGSPVVGQDGVCGFGKLCRKCFEKGGRVGKLKKRAAWIMGESDADFIRLLASLPSGRKAAKAMGVSAAIVYARARQLGVKPNALHVNPKLSPTRSESIKASWARRERPPPIRQRPDRKRPKLSQ